MDRSAKGRQCAPPHHVRLRKGPDLGQRQLSHQRGAGERRPRDRQYRPSGRRLRSDGRPSGRLFASVRRPCRPSGGLRRQVVDGRQGRRASHLGMRPLQDHAERLQVQAELQEAHRHREGCDDDSALRRSRRHGQGDRGRDQEGWSVRRRRRHRADQDRRGLSRRGCRRRRRERPTSRP